MARLKKNRDSDMSPEAQAAAKSGKDMVTVAFMSVRSQLFRLGDRDVLIRGTDWSLAGKDKGILSVGRYGYTRIAAEDWQEIERLYGSMKIFKSGLIFAEKSRDSAEDRAEDQEELRHGLEPADPKASHDTQPANDKE